MGELLPDERRSDIYKLYRATRCGPDSTIDPSTQVALYDPGLGSSTDNDCIKIRGGRNLLSQATGLGINKNIIDCHSGHFSGQRLRQGLTSTRCQTSRVVNFK